ncbi:MAG: hypothetical protein WC136_01980 [Sphaerochaeta sp.]|nr:hypothetical protein [Sphaerochaeta sp.]
MQLDRIIIYFFLYSIIGYISEVIYCSFPLKRFVNRGFLHGPYLPIYGFGALIVLSSFSGIKELPLLVFFLAMISTSVLEYLTSYLLETLFHAKLWDYSKNFGNIRGRVCLLNSTLFGIMGVVVLYGVHPLVVNLVSMIPQVVLQPVSKVILVSLCVDTTSSVVRMTSFQKQLSEFKRKGKELEERIELIRVQGASASLDALRAKFDVEREEMKLRLEQTSRHFLNAFPSITSANEETRLQFELLRMNFRDYRDRLKKSKNKLKQAAKNLHR